MAKEKSKEESKDQADAKQAAEAAPAAEQPKKAALEIPTVGRIVHFHREQNTGNGVKLIAQAAIVIGEAKKESNLPVGSVDLGVFTIAGYETRHGVMPSEDGKPKAARWTWPARS